MSQTIVVTVPDSEVVSIARFLAEGLFDGRVETLQVVPREAERYVRPDHPSPYVMKVLGADYEEAS